jgi:hypothetical protein
MSAACCRGQPAVDLVGEVLRLAGFYWVEPQLPGDASPWGGQ